LRTEKRSGRVGRKKRPKKKEGQTAEGAGKGTDRGEKLREERGF